MTWSDWIQVLCNIATTVGVFIAVGALFEM